MALGFYRARNRKELNGLGDIPVVQTEVDFLANTINNTGFSVMVRAKVVLQRWLRFDPSGREAVYLAFIRKYPTTGSNMFRSIFRPSSEGGLRIEGVIENIWTFLFKAPIYSEVRIIDRKLEGKYPGMTWNVSTFPPLPGEKTEQEKILEEQEKAAKKKMSIFGNWKMMVGLGVVGVAAAVIATRKKKGA